MSEIKHENLNMFIGAVIESPLVFVVTAYCQKGNLRETLENDSITLDAMFFSSIVFDILKVKENINLRIPLNNMSYSYL